MADRESLGNEFQLVTLIDRLAARPAREIRFPIRRPDDHLVLDLLFDNLHVDSSQQPPQLTREDAARRGVLIVEFPPQSFGEQAFQKVTQTLDADPGIERPLDKPLGKSAAKQKPAGGTEPVNGLGAAYVRMSGRSRLAFTMPADVAGIPFTLEAVLDAMRLWPLRLDVNALPDVPIVTGRLERTFEVIHDAISVNLDPRVRSDVGVALKDSARRIAETAAGGLHESRTDLVSSVMWSGIREESAQLAARYPELAAADLHTATLAALALGSGARLGRLAESSGIAEQARPALEKLPYFPLLFGVPHEPSRSVTALELPYRLVMSPIGDARWQHASLPIVHHGRAELWHTRLNIPAASGGEGPAQVRALWSPDYEQPVKPPFTMSLDETDRQFLVALMADWTQHTGRWPFQPKPSTAHRLHLSSLGALIDVEGTWDRRPDDVDLEQWRHLASLGRDHYVRVVYAGYLVPFGHAASLVKVTERVFEGNPEGDLNARVAVLRQRFFILVRERIRGYVPLRPDHELKGRNFPFTKVEILTRVTPDLLQPDGAPGIPAPLELGEKPWFADPSPLDRMVFWPQLPGIDFRFEVAATDRAGSRVTFSLPMLFVSEVINADHARVVREVYSSELDLRRTADLGGADITYDIDPAADPNDSRKSTVSLTFNTKHIYPFDHTTTSAAPSSRLEPNFFPEIDTTVINDPALQKLLARSDGFPMTYPQVNTAAEFDNAGRVFLWAKEQSVKKIDFGGGGNQSKTDALGGLASPVSAIVGLSSTTGPISGPDNVSINKAVGNAVSNVFDPSEFFGQATLLGGIQLGSVVDAAAASGLGAAPKFLSRQNGGDVVTTFDWETAMKADPASIFIPNADGSGASRLKMHGKVVTPGGGGSVPTREAFATINNFKLNLFGCIVLWFDKITFDAKPGQKPDVTVQLNPGDHAVVFGGPLEFVNEIRQYIPSNGFSDPPTLSVTPSGISAGYSLGLPTIAVGIFSLSNVSLAAGFNLPFDNRPISVRFNLSERQRPFSLIVSLLGGGGFFAIAIGSKGVEEIEAALEFGAAIAINLGVASGSVEIKAGVYFHWKDDGAKSTVVIAGYVRIHGELTVLCLISASLTFNLQIGYQKSPGQSMVFGEAELIVEIEVLFLSFDVSVRCRREFAGGAADPKFIDLIPKASVWAEYCEAFAPEA